MPIAHVTLRVLLGSFGLLAVLSVPFVKRSEEFRVEGGDLCWRCTSLFGARNRQRPLRELRAVRVGSLLHGVFCEWTDGGVWRTYFGGARTDLAAQIAATLEAWRSEDSFPNRQNS